MGERTQESQMVIQSWYRRCRFCNAIMVNCHPAQYYCDNACRQAAYRKRKAKVK